MVPGALKMAQVLGVKVTVPKQSLKDPLRKDLDLLNPKKPQDKKRKVSYLQVRTHG